MRLAELLEGDRFVTRLTRREGRVVAHTDRGVLVELAGWFGPRYLHPEVVVNQAPPQ